MDKVIFADDIGVTSSVKEDNQDYTNPHITFLVVYTETKPRNRYQSSSPWVDVFEFPDEFGIENEFIKIKESLTTGLLEGAYQPEDVLSVLFEFAGMSMADCITDWYIREGYTGINNPRNQEAFTYKINEVIEYLKDPALDEHYALIDWQLAVAARPYFKNQEDIDFINARIAQGRNLS